MPASIHGGFQGTARVFQQSLANEPWLIAAALAAVYIVLGILYESLIHPLTILSTLPSAGAGAMLALAVTHTEFTVIALIGLILLIGIVKKNAIMMIDVAIDGERARGSSLRKRRFDEASMLRLRPILMTTMAALLGALPMAISSRHRLGAPPSAGRHDHRRADRQPAAHPVHDPGAIRGDGAASPALGALARAIRPRLSGAGAAVRL